MTPGGGPAAGSFRVAGLDLASQDARTAMAVLQWDSGRVTVRELGVGIGNRAIVEVATRVSVLGIDCPFGWPVAFTDLMVAQRAGTVKPETAADAPSRRRLAYRRTDAVVRERTGRWPLSVSADKIAYPAMRCAGLLATLSAQGHPVRRSGIGSKVAEVYPAAALARWRLAVPGYKLDGPGLPFAVQALTRAAPWLELGEHDGMCRHSHDAFDAVIAGLVAGAVQLGRVEAVPEEDRQVADEEGWIHLPDTDFLDSPRFGVIDVH